MTEPVFLVREYWPNFVDVSREPREQIVTTKDAALEIPWIKEKDDISRKGSFVKSGKYVVAIILKEDGSAYAP